MAKNRTIESGFVENHIWIGRHDGFYEPVKIGSTGRVMHALRFTVKEAQLAVEMLQEEIARKLRNRGEMG